MSSALTETWLLGLGFDPEPEPAWITTGQKPDFYARGPVNAWVEVKDLGPTDHHTAFGHAWNDLHTRCAETQATGWLYACIGASDQRAAKSAMRHVERIYKEVTKYGPNYVVVIPPDAAYGTNVRLEYTSSDKKRTVQVGPTSISGQYTCMPGLEPAYWGEHATLISSTGTQTVTRLDKLLLGRVPALLTLQLHHSDQHLSLGAGNAEVYDNTSQSRIRRQVAESNKQIRNGQRYAGAPGIAVIYQDFPDALDAERLLGALFGDLALELIPQLSSGGKFVVRGNWKYTANAVLTKTANRGVSAVRYVRHEKDPILVVNPHAEHPLPWEHFAESAWALESDHFALRPREPR